MSFTSKNLNHPSKSGMTFLKGATLFFLGMSAVMFLTQAFEIVPSVRNAKQYIQEIIFTADGYSDSSQTVTIDGSGGNAYFAGKLGIGVSDPDAKLHINNGGLKITESESDIDINIDDGWPKITSESRLLGVYDTIDDSAIGFYSISDKDLYLGTDSNEIIRIKTGGNVGIGTTTPGYDLDVAGTGRFDGVCIGADCRTTRPTGGTVVEVEGDSLWNTGISNVIYYNSGRVGIGTDTPGYDLDVDGTGRFNNLLIVSGTSPMINLSSTQNMEQFGIQFNDYLSTNIGSITAFTYNWGGTTTGFRISSNNGYPILFNTNGDTERMIITTSGNVGIGTTTPGYALDVAGTGSFDEVCIAGECMTTWPTGGIAVSGDYYPLAGNSISNPVTGDFYMDNGTGSYTIEIGTTNMIVGTPTDVEGPIISPVSYVPGMGPFPIMVTKGWNMFLGEPGQDTQMLIMNADTNFGTIFLQKHDEAKFSIVIQSGGLTSYESSFDFLNDGRIRAHPDPSSVISDDGDFITKGYLDSAIDTGDFVTVGTYGDIQTIIGDKEFQGGVWLNGPRSSTLTWLPGGGNTGFHFDQDGIEYVGFSCSDFGDNSLVNKSCIEAMITGASFDYLPLSGNTEGTQISGDVYIKDDKILHRGTAGGRGYINGNSYSLSIAHNDTVNQQNPSFQLTNGNAVIGYSDYGNSITRTVILGVSGFVYAADYSGSYTARSLIDKGYADATYLTELTAESDPVWSAASGDYIPRIGGTAPGSINFNMDANDFVITNSDSNVELYEDEIIIYADGTQLSMGGTARLSAGSSIQVAPAKISIDSNTPGFSGMEYITLPVSLSYNTVPYWGAISGNYANINIYTGLTLGYVPYRNGSIFTNSYLFATGGMIGLGITTPEYALDVSGAIQSNDAFYLTGGTIPRKITLSGDNLSFQAYTGGSRVEKGKFTP